MSLNSTRVEDAVRALSGDPTQSETYKDIAVRLIVINSSHGMRSRGLKKMGLFHETLL